MKTRTEFDSIGSMEVPENAYYGVQSLRAMQNFQITGRKLHPKFIESLAIIKSSGTDQLSCRTSGSSEGPCDYAGL